MNSPAQQIPNMLLEISGEISPERMKGWSQGKNNTQLLPGATTGDHTHDKVMWKRTVKQGFRNQQAP